MYILSFGEPPIYARDLDLYVDLLTQLPSIENEIFNVKFSSFQSSRNG